MNYITLCKYHAGSVAYGTNTSDSDLDVRGTYLVTDKRLIINPYAYSSNKCATKALVDGVDEVYYEIRHFLHMLTRSNTVCLEMLFNKKWIELTPCFNAIIENRRSLVNPDGLHESLLGYCKNEYRLALGERAINLGNRTPKTSQQFDFSPKNFMNLLRLLYCGEEFFATGVYPVDMTATPIFHQLTEITRYPERFTLARLNEMYEERLSAFEYTWSCCRQDVKKKYSYNENIATELMLACYKDLLTGDKSSLIARLAAYMRGLVT